LLDSLAGFAGGNQAAFIGGLHSLRQDAFGCRAYLNRGLTANKRIGTFGLSHAFTVTRIGGQRKQITEHSAQSFVPSTPFVCYTLYPAK
jgi:hypothetical protein